MTEQREKKGCVARRSEGIPATVTELTERRRVIHLFSLWREELQNLATKTSYKN